MEGRPKLETKSPWSSFSAVSMQSSAVVGLCLCIFKWNSLWSSRFKENSSKINKKWRRFDQENPRIKKDKNERVLNCTALRRVSAAPVERPKTAGLCSYLYCVCVCVHSRRTMTRINGLYVRLGLLYPAESDLWLTSSVKDRTISILDRVDSPSGPSWSNLESDPWDLERRKRKGRDRVIEIRCYI